MPHIFLPQLQLLRPYFLSIFRSRPRPKKKAPVPEGGVTEAGAASTGEAGEANAGEVDGEAPMETYDFDGNLVPNEVIKAKPRIKSRTPSKPKPSK